MNRVATGLSAVFLAAAVSAPAEAQQADRAAPEPTYILCTGDYVCADDPSVVAAWPLERWGSVRRQQGTQASPAAPPPAGEQQQLARRPGQSTPPATP